MKMRRMKSFGEDICKLEITTNIARGNKTRLESITDKMTVNLAVFCLFMKHQICSNVKA